MNVTLTPQAAELLQVLQACRHQPVETILEDALRTLADQPVSPSTEASILDLQGLGKEIWQGIDAQEYITRERSEWNG